MLVLGRDEGINQRKNTRSEMTAWRWSLGKSCKWMKSDFLTKGFCADKNLSKEIRPTFFFAFSNTNRPPNLNQKTNSVISTVNKMTTLWNNSYFSYKYNSRTMKRRLSSFTREYGGSIKIDKKIKFFFHSYI